MDEVQEEMIKEYEEYLLDLAKNDSKEIFTNGGIRHASVLMSVLLKNTKDYACIFSEGFCPDIIQEPYLTALKSYVNDKRLGLKILLETDLYIEKEPILSIRHKSKERNGSDKRIEIRLIQEEDKQQIFKVLNCSQCNFSVFDGKMYRFEYDPKHYKAYGSFNHKNNSTYLTSLFEKAFNRAKVIC